MDVETKSIAEAALFASGRLLPLHEISKLCGIDKKKARDLLAELMSEYSTRGSGIEIFEVDSGFGMRVVRRLEGKVMYLVPETDMPKSVLKTLALIVHEEPIKQSDLVKVRGNRVYAYIRKLRELDLIEAKKMGRTRILKTTAKFREYFSVEDVKGFRKK